MVCSNDCLAEELNLKFSYVLMFVLLVSCGSKPEGVVAIEQMLVEMEAAVHAQDVEQLMSHFAPDAAISISMPAALGGDIDVGLADYEAMLAISWSIPADYSYEVKDVSIDFHADQTQATVTDTVYETMSMSGEVMFSTKTVQTLLVELVNDKPLIKSLQGQVELLKD